MSKPVPFQTIQFNILTQFTWKTVLFRVIQFSISTKFSSIWRIYRNLSGDTTVGQIESGSDGIEGVLRIPQSSSIIGMSPPDCMVSYPGLSLGVGVLLQCKCVFGVFYSPSRLGNGLDERNIGLIIFMQIVLFQTITAVYNFKQLQQFTMSTQHW